MSLLNDRIDILSRNATETPPTKRVLRTVSVILALVRVGSSILSSPRIVSSDRCLDQDKMIHNKDSVQLPEYCFDLCHTLETAIQGKVVDDLNGSMRASLENLERCVDGPHPRPLPINNYRAYAKSSGLSGGGRTLRA